MSYSDIRTAIADTVRTSVRELQCYPKPPDSISAPAFVVGALKRTGRETWEPANKLTFDLLLLVTRTSPNWELLDDFCSPTGDRSVQAALEADGTLGGVISDLNVLEVEQAGEVEIGGAPFYGAVITAEVWI